MNPGWTPVLRGQGGGKIGDRGPYDGRNYGRPLRLNAKGNERFPRVRSFFAR